MEELAKHSSIPVINGLSNSFHPCQILADLLTIYENKKKLRGLKVAWIGDGNNVCNSWLYVPTGMNITVASPKGYTPDSNVVKDASQQRDHNNGSWLQNDDPLVEYLMRT